MGRKRMFLKVLSIIISAFLMVAAIFLGITAVIFALSGGNGAPDIFGKNIYIVEGGDFYTLKNGTAAIADRIWFDEIVAGDMILFNDNSRISLSIVKKSELVEGIMSYDIEDSAGELRTISQGQYIAKITYYSDFLGGLIKYVSSPFGVLTIAVLPCLAVFAFEIVRFIFSKLPEPEVEPVKIQQDTPEFIPIAEREKINRQRMAKSEENKKEYEKKVLGASPVTAVKKPERPAAPTPARTETRADAVKDRVEFSKSAGEHLKAERRLDASNVLDIPTRTRRADTPQKTAPAEPAKAAAAPAPKPAPMIEKPSPAPETEKQKPADYTPDISLIFKEDKDERYDIEDILADIERRKK